MGARALIRVSSVAAVALAVALPGHALARDGKVDRSFGGGRVILSFDPGGGAEGPTSLIPLRSGGVFSGGIGGGNGWGLSLHDRAGNPFGFGGDGLAYHKITTPSPPGFSAPAEFSRAPGGGWIGVGFADEGGPRSVAIARFTAAGELDPSFGNDPPNATGDGIVRIDFPGTEDFATGVDLDRSGRLVVSGFSRAGPMTHRLWVMRLMPDGSPDSTFGTAGLVSPLLGANDQAEDVAVLRNGRILVAGVSDGDLVVIRVTPSGTLDGAFGGGDAIAEVPGFGIELESNAKLAPLPNGKILVGVNDGEVSGFTSNAVVGVARFSKSGVLDRAFSGDGLQRIATGDSQYFGDIAVADDGTIVINSAFRAGPGGTDNQALVIRLRPSGARDRAFGDRGLVFYGQPDVSERGGPVAITGDRRIYIAADISDGTSGNGVIARLFGDTRRPGTKITAGPKGEVPPGRYRFRFRALRDVHTKFQCSLAAAKPNSRRADSFRSCRSPFNVRVTPAPTTCCGSGRSTAPATSTRPPP
ncbi:MAG TPA: hypothetical protein VKA89_07535, partial [Solirubrobacterales bacterium]|nr:hypothetical protein [Solirubrobacterales bacterium]